MVAKLCQSCLTLCDPIDGSPPGPSVPGILQARILEWAAISFSITIMEENIKNDFLYTHTHTHTHTYICIVELGFPGGSAVKNLSAKAGDLGLITGWGRAPGGGHGNPLQYSCLENAMDRGAWWATVHGVTKSQTQLSTHAWLNHFAAQQKLTQH